MNPHPDFIRHIELVLGTGPAFVELDKFIRFSTNGLPHNKSGWCKLFDEGVVGVFGDFRTDSQGIWVHPNHARLNHIDLENWRIRLVIERQQAQLVRHQEMQTAKRRNDDLWNAALPIERDDPVSLYLANRGIDLPTAPEALRFHPALECWDDGRLLGSLPAMLGLVTDSSGGMVSIHRTYLSHAGKKADVPVVKKLTPCSAPLAGAAVRLSGLIDYDNSDVKVGAAEGIETALACMMATGIPTDAAVSASGLARYLWPVCSQLDLYIFADNDANGVGQKAAAALERRAAANGHSVRTLTPTEPGADWADVWARKTVSE